MKMKTQFHNRVSFRRIAIFSQITFLLACLFAGNAEAQLYRVLYAFSSDGILGRQPMGKLAQGPDGTLYGTTCYGGYLAQSPYGGFGTVFKVNPDGTGFTVLKQFLGTDGADPQGGLVLSGNTLYGTASSGHTSDLSNTVKGVVFKMDTDGNNFTILHSFAGGSDGVAPTGNLLLSGQTLYGTTYYGGSANYYGYGCGTIYKVNTDGTGYQILKSLPQGSDSFPYGGLIQINDALYGTASCYPTFITGSTTNGAIFKINTNGTGYGIVLAFPGGINGACPAGVLAYSGNSLYGVTTFGGNSDGDLNRGDGTLFKVNLDGTGFTILHRFSKDLYQPNGGLLLVGSTLYGTTVWASSPYGGKAYKIETDGSGFAAFMQFTLDDGFEANGDLVLSGTTLYGTTQGGGPGRGAALDGVVFALSIAPPVVETTASDRTAEAGSTIYLDVGATNNFEATYQWFFNTTTPVSSVSTNPILKLANLGFEQSGPYTAVINTIFGSTTSTPISLSVIAPTPHWMAPAIHMNATPGAPASLLYRDACDPASSWQPAGNTTMNGSSNYYFDLSTPLPPHRFYRTLQNGSPETAPVLDLTQVPVLALSGNAGDTLRLDCINVFGPTNAWATLANVTLTNTSQNYVDLSSLGQPPRLYRILNGP